VGELVLQLLAASLTLHWPRRVETAFPATEGLRMAWAALSEQLTSGRSTCPNLFPLPVEPPSKTPPPQQMAFRANWPAKVGNTLHIKAASIQLLC